MVSMSMADGSGSTSDIIMLVVAGTKKEKKRFVCLPFAAFYLSMVQNAKPPKIVDVLFVVEQVGSQGILAWDQLLGAMAILGEVQRQ